MWSKERSIIFNKYLVFIAIRAILNNKLCSWHKEIYGGAVYNDN